MSEGSVTTTVRHTRRRKIEPFLPTAGVLMRVYLAFMQPPSRSLFASADQRASAAARLCSVFTGWAGSCISLSLG
jgi:hypothetical protein